MRMAKGEVSMCVEVWRSNHKLWVLEGYNGHPHRYPEEPPDAELLPVGAEGNRNGRRWYFLDLPRLSSR